jgi:hypothetical protein
VSTKPSTLAGVKKKRQTAAAGQSHGRIHPVIIYPFRPEKSHSDIEELYGLVGQLAGEPEIYARPITVMDCKTRNRLAGDKRFKSFRDSVVAATSDLIEAWCVDTCQMWYTGLGAAHERGAPGDVYWLIPGDFNYGSAVGREVLGHLHDLPEICVELKQDICIGEIATSHDHPKHLIDTYGTFALLYNWFPAEAREIRQYTERPRSEFFAIRHEFLGEMLNRRWFAYEQTVIMLLHAVFDQKRISRFFVGNICDLPEGRESVASAQQQLERIERALKTLWRERHDADATWMARFRPLEEQSGQIRCAGMNILASLLA